MKYIYTIIIGVLVYAGFATRTFGYLDLTTAGASVDYYGTVFTQEQTQPAGTGVFDSFLRIQANGTESGYNTSGTPAPLDDKRGAWTHNLQLNQLAQVTVNGVKYYDFNLDINEPSSDTQSLLSLDVLKFYTSATGSKTTEEELNSLGTLRYDLSAHGTTYVLLDAKTGKPGSGSSDMQMLIPVSTFAGAKATDYVYLYSQFGSHASSGGGFEEWSAATGSVSGSVAAVPEPSTTALFGGGLLLVLGFAWKRRTQAAA